MRKYILLGVAVLAVLGGLAGLGRWWTVGRFFESTDDAYVQADITVVSPKVEGYVRTLLVAENQTVKAGDVLVVIEDRDFRARVEQAAAVLSGEQAAIRTFDTRLELQQAVIAQAVATVSSAVADARRAAQDYQRYRNLARDDFASRQRLETAEADQSRTEAALARAQAALAAERSQVAVITAQQAEARSRLVQAEASLALTRNNLDDTVIRSPVDGVIGNKAVQLGQYVKIGTQLASVVPITASYVTANFKETQLQHMRAGQSVDIAVDAYAGARIVGRVESFSPASGAKWSLLPPENATGNFTKVVQRLPVRIAVPADNPLAGALRPGLSVTVSVDTRAGERGRSELAWLFGAPASAQP